MFLLFKISGNSLIYFKIYCDITYKCTAHTFKNYKNKMFQILNGHQNEKKKRNENLYFIFFMLKIESFKSFKRKLIKDIIVGYEVILNLITFRWII